MEMYSLRKYKKIISALAVVPCLFFILSVCFYQSSKAQCINTFPHVEDFETAATWTAYTAPTSTWSSNDWAWGTPNHTYVIKSAGSGNKCWCVGGLTGAFYNFWEQSYVLSPCYDFTTLKYPHIKFRLFYDSEYEYDGANLQTSIDGGVTWQDVGTVGGTKANPIREATDCNTANWYNYTSIEYLNKPAGFVTSTHGWCGNKELGGKGWDQTPGNTGVTCVGDSGIGHWVTAQHCLTGLAGQPNVMFRFTFGGGYTCNDFDGFAFDSVAVSNGIPNTTGFTSSCVNSNTLKFTVPSVACPTNAWAWNFGDAASGASNTSATENPSHTFSGPGTYTVTLIASGGACNPPDTATQVVHILNATITSFSNATCNTLGSATALATGGTAPVYSWSNGTNGASTSNLAAGTYTVNVTDPSACPTMTTVTITQPTPIVIALTSTPASCNTNNGTASVSSVTGGTSPYSYSWAGSSGAVGTNSTSINGLAAGNYTLTVTDINSCTASKAVTVTNSSGLNVTVSTTSISCNGGANGSITLNATGGTAPISYSWSPTGSGASTASLPAGTYTVIVTDASPCNITNIINLVQPTALTATATSTPATCGQSNGTANVSVSGGTLPYNTTYTWSPVGGSAATATNLPGNTYNVTIADANGCKVTAQTVVAQQSSINLSVSNTSAKCGINNGTATAIATGGNGTITYTWSPSGGNTNTATGLAPGNYTISVSDASGCVTFTNTTVGNNPSPVLTTTVTNVLCFGASTGSASVSINAGTGTAPFTYNWSPSGGTNSVADNLSAGATTAGTSYTVLVTDNVNCTASAVVTITQPAALTVTATNTTTTCGLSNGSTSCTASGGTPNYTYKWLPTGGTSNPAINLPGNTYTVTVTDANNCTATAQTTVAQTTSVTLTVSNTPAKCGINNGTATAVAGGGTGTLTYTWSPSGGNTTAATNLAPGIYTIAVSDMLGCLSYSNTVVGNNPSPVLSTTFTNVLCYGGTGSASVSVNAGTGTGPFVYSWSPAGGSAATASNLSAGTTTGGITYTVLVSDAVNCRDSATVTITQPPALTVTASGTQGTCGLANGSTTCTALGGTPAYSYTWIPSGGNSAVATNLMGGAQPYTVVVKDANNCIQTASVSINETPPLTILPVSTNVTCFGGVDGLIVASANGGTGIPTYTLQTGGVTGTASTYTFTGLSGSITGTTYTVSAMDNVGCIDSKTVTITEPPPIIISVNNPTICDGFSAVLTASVSGGNGTAPSYTWNPGGATTASIQVSPANLTQYNVSVENTGCTQVATAVATVNVYPPVKITITPSDSVCKGQQTTLVANASGGDGTSFAYSWSNGPTTQTIVVSPGSTTVYSVTAKDNSCPAVDTSTQVSIYKNPVINIFATPTQGCGAVCVSFTATAGSVPGNNISSNYSWYYGDGSTYTGTNFTGHCYYKTGSYDVTLIATTQHNCIDTLKKLKYINVHPKPMADFTASTYETNIDNATVHFYNQSTGIDIVNLNWFIDTTKASIPNPYHTFLNEGTYPVTLIVTDSMGCKDTIVRDIIITPDYTFYAPNCLTPNGDGKNESFIPVGTGWDNNSYHLWIYDRWGVQVLHSTNPYLGWNGTKNDGPVQQDTYVWEVSLSDIFGKPHTYHGIVSVVR